MSLLFRSDDLGFNMRGFVFRAKNAPLMQPGLHPQSFATGLGG